jgi:hypothetical protein
MHDVEILNGKRRNEPRDRAPMPQYPGRHTAARHREDGVERLIDRLPALRRTIRWLRRPSSWVRVPAGLLLIVGSL